MRGLAAHFRARRYTRGPGSQGLATRPTKMRLEASGKLLGRPWGRKAPCHRHHVLLVLRCALGCTRLDFPSLIVNWRSLRSQFSSPEDFLPANLVRRLRGVTRRMTPCDRCGARSSHDGSWQKALCGEISHHG